MPCVKKNSACINAATSSSSSALNLAFGFDRHEQPGSVAVRVAQTQILSYHGATAQSDTGNLKEVLWPVFRFKAIIIN